MNLLYRRIKKWHDDPIHNAVLRIPPERIQYYDSKTKFWIVNFPWEKMCFFFEAKKVKYDEEFHLTMRNHMSELVFFPFKFRVKK